MKQADMQATASDVARYLLEKRGTLTGYQLQKLLYYCQAWMLAVEGRPLFADEVKAYDHGPAVPSVSMQHQGLRIVHASDIRGKSSMVVDHERAFIDCVTSAYEGMSGDQLEQLTHEEDTWRNSYNSHTGVNSSAEISQDEMKAYYAKLLASSDEVQRHHHVPRFDAPKKLYVSSGDYEWLMDYLGEEA